MGGMRRAGVLALTAVLGLGLTACGDDDGEDAQEEVSGDETTATTETSDSDTTDADLGDFSGECAGFSEAFAGAGQAVGSAFSGGDSEDLEGMATYFDEVADRVPDAIRDDFRLFADAYGKFTQALADSDVDFSDPSSMDPEAGAQLRSLGEAFSAPEVQAASENIKAWVTENCEGS